MTGSSRRGYAHTPRGAIHYAEAGSGPPLLLLHATPGSYRAYRELLPRLAPDFRAIAVDTPGFGASDPLAGVTIEGLAQSLVELLDALGLPRAHVFGLHTGNKIAAALAARWPERVDRVVLAGQTHSLIVEQAQRDAAIAAIVDHYFPKYGAGADGAHLLRGWTAARAETEQLWWSDALLNAAVVEAKAVAAHEANVIDYLLSWRSIVPTYQAIFAFDLAAAMRQMAAPTQVLELLTDAEMHFGTQRETICKMMRNARPAAIEHADGTVLHTRPDEVLRAIVPFLLERQDDLRI
jgi:pimeloyl-ACP methyl ester carboxylesterase